MNILQHLRIDWFAFGLDIRNLAANHSVNRAGGSSNFHDDGGAALCGGGCCTDCFERQSQESIPREDGGGLAEFLVASRFAAAEVIVVQSRQIIVNQGIGVDELDGASGMKRGCEIAGENTRRFKAEDRTNAFSTREDAITHCRVNRSGWGRFGRQEPL